MSARFVKVSNLVAAVIVSTPPNVASARGSRVIVEGPAVALPMVSAISPALGDAAGGVSVTITGANYIGVVGVTINGVPCTSVVTVNPTTITCITPAITASLSGRDVSVTNSVGTGTLAGGFVSFLPTLLSGLSLWARADLGTTIATGVSAWADQSGSGHNLTQATGSKQPALTATDAAYNNKSTLRFTSANAQYLATATFGAALTQPYTIVLVGNDDGTATPQMYYSDQSVGGYFYQNGAGHYALTTGAPLTDPTSASSAPRVVALVCNGGSSKIFNNAMTAAVSGAAGAGSLAELTLGIYFDLVSQPLNGKIAEVIVYNRALSNTEIPQIQNYAGGRYAITIGP